MWDVYLWRLVWVDPPYCVALMDSQDFDRFGYIWYALVLIDTKSVAFVTCALVVILEALIPYPSPKGIFCFFCRSLQPFLLGCCLNLRLLFWFSCNIYCYFAHHSALFPWEDEMSTFCVWSRVAIIEYTFSNLVAVNLNLDRNLGRIVKKRRKTISRDYLLPPPTVNLNI